MIIADEAAMHRLGVQIAEGLRAGNLVTLSGTLGAGKTVLAKAIIAAVGFEGDVSSPTFAIIHQYDEAGMRIPVVHADLYRLDDPEDLDELGLFDDDRAVLLVEWPEKGGAPLLQPDLAIEILPLAGGARQVTIKDKRK
jgi:tRNA threonylcarbamoyladenosine biosynthesis protein TsaE